MGTATGVVPATTPALGRFVADLEALTLRHPQEHARVFAIADRLQALLAEPDVVPTRLMKPLPDRYRRNLLHRDAQNRFVVMALVWGKGQFTPVHDHGAFSVVGVYRNRLEITNYMRTDDRKREGRATLAATVRNVGRPGSVFHVVPPSEEIHTVGNSYPEAAVSIHVYGREIEWVNVFDLAAGTVRRSDPLAYHNDL
ncbi:MAG: cysteine dioxygenase family protein [Planctomycetes bacterium]|nr:cysteine dioxygenase family protein [Planctomycetota bacterium]